MEWLDTLEKIVPVFGPLGAVFLVMWAWEKYDHERTRAELRRCNDLRIAEAIALKAVVESSNAASVARDASQGEISRALGNFTTMWQLTQVERRVQLEMTSLLPPSPPR